MRQSRKSQPYWVVQSANAGDSPVTLSPTPSTGGRTDPDDPPFTAELAAAKMGKRKKGEALDKGKADSCSLDLAPTWSCLVDLTRRKCESSHMVS